MKYPNLPAPIGRLPLLFLFLTMPFASLCAQEVLTVQGRVVSSNDNHPLKSVIVNLRTLPDSAVAKRVGTNAQGSFSIAVPAGRSYMAEFRYISHEIKYVQIPQQSGEVSLGTITLKETALQGEGVEVSGWREFTKVMPDKRVYVVKDNPNIVASTVSEVLDQVPSVQVDENGAIKLRGDENVTIMINDHPLKMDKEERNRYLQQLPSMNINSIEVRTAPGAKFDAKLNGGIINIITEKGLADYVGGNLYANGTSSRRWGGGGTFYYNDSTYTSSVNVGMFHMYNRTTTLYKRDAPDAPVERYLEKLLTSYQDYNSYYANPQVDISLSKNDLLSFSASLNYTPGDFQNMGVGSRHDVNQQLLQNVHDTSTNLRNSSWMDYSLLYRHQYSEQKKLSIDLNFSRWGNNRDEYKSSLLFSPAGEVDSVRSLRQQSIGNEHNPAFNFRADYATGISDDLSMEVGTKVEAERTPTELTVQRFDFLRTVYELDSEQTSILTPYYTMIGAYTNIAYQFTKDFSVQAGARYEYAMQGADFVGNPVRHDYPNLFPSASLSWSLSPEYRITASYNRSIAVPWVGLLNPRTTRETATTRYVGNPNIRPEFTHNIELSAMAFLGGTTLTFSPYYKRTVDDIRFNVELQSDIMITSYQNFNGADIYGIDGSISHRSKSGFSTRLNFDIQHYRNRGSTASTSDLPSDVLYASCNANISYQFLSNLYVSIGGRYVSPYTMGGEKALSYVTTNVNMVYKLMDNNLTLTLTGADPLNIEQRTRINTGNGGFTLSSDAKSISQYISLNLSYSFGKKNINLEQHNRERTTTRGEG